MMPIIPPLKPETLDEEAFYELGQTVPRVPKFLMQMWRLLTERSPSVGRMAERHDYQSGRPCVPH
ncbi:MAG: hypothetical protein AAF739_09375 [Pseudomonadota bacterium]